MRRRAGLFHPQARLVQDRGRVRHVAVRKIGRHQVRPVATKIDVFEFRFLRRIRDQRHSVPKRSIVKKRIGLIEINDFAHVGRHRRRRHRVEGEQERDRLGRRGGKPLREANRGIRAQGMTAEHERRMRVGVSDRPLGLFPAVERQNLNRKPLLRQLIAEGLESRREHPGKPKKQVDAAARSARGCEVRGWHA